jgi:hypothetical protein
MKSPIRGPNCGPRKGLSVYNIIGAASLFFGNKSPTVPPATLRKAAPAKPSMKREIIIVSIFFATAQGMIQTTKKKREIT